MPAKPNHPLVRDFLANHRLDWSDHHRQVGTSVLNMFTTWLDTQGVELEEASKAECTEYMAIRKQAVAISTATKDYQFLRWFFEWREEEDGVRNPMRGVKGHGKVTSDPDRTPHITEETYTKLMATFDKRKTLDCRNAAICSLMYWSGARGSEVCRADLAKLDIDNAVLMIYGKNKEWAPMHLSAETCRLIERYLRRRGSDRSPALFVGTAGTAAADGRLKSKAVYDMLRRRTAAVGCHMPLHAFRRGMAINAKRRGLNDTTVQHLGRWKDSRMVAHYQRNAQAELAAAEFHAADPTARSTGRTGRRKLRSVI
jgi:site-specific recombinase XerD